VNSNIDNQVKLVEQKNLTIKGIKINYGIISIEHFPELQRDIQQLDEEGKISTNSQFREYIENMKFEVPDNFPTAKYVVILAREDKLALVNFIFKGKKHEVMISPGYYQSGLKNEDLIDLIQTQIIKEKGFKVENAQELHLKLLAVRSGLTRYGRNNISYTNDLGSFLALSAYFTDFDFKNDVLHEKKMLDECGNCKICMKACPNNCISEDNFVINVDKCITLYNEVEGEFPNWIKPDTHNALFGCMKCQMFCVANKQVMKNPIRFDDITEEETNALLNGDKDITILESISKKLRISIASNADYYLPLIKRNLGVLLI